MNQVYKNLALWMVIGLIVILLFTVFQGAQQGGQEQPNFSEFLRAVDQGRVESVVIRGNHVTYSLKDSAQMLRTYIVEYPDLIKTLKDRGVRIAVKPPDANPWYAIFPVGADAPLHRRLDLLHAPDAGRWREGAVVRQGPRATHLGEAEQGHLPGRRGRRRGQGGAAGDHRLPQGPAEVSEARRQDSEGRSSRWSARNRQDAARQGDRRRGERAVLLHLGLGLCREDRKSTRLNSSHSQISYAVFCLKKKKNE